MAWSGKLNEVVEIYDLVTSERNIYGEEVAEMEKIYVTRAQVIYTGGSRTMVNDETRIPYAKRFIMRIYVPVSDTSWIKWKDNYYRVTSIDVSREWQEQTVDTVLVNE